MAPVNSRIYRYQYEQHLSSGDKGVQPLATLYLYGKSDKLLGAIAFLPVGAPLTPASESEHGIVSGVLPIPALPRLIDMLRNEKPVTFCWAADSQTLRLTTDSEPVGEEELKRFFSFLYV